ncbi:RagB/SusD family nutrient uptake outer membrane protein [Rufibacter immobilis]|uniref:RagB/SusD family nutrient uptake outer membrane protein n=1 Tax=Rufibacter immobilis TaxID=1348778 RepID=UPI0035EC1980
MFFKKYTLTLAALLCLLTACTNDLDDYLDKAETGGMTLEEVFGDYVQAEKFLANVYAQLPSEYDTKYSAATDEAKSPHGTAPENEINNGVFTPARNPYNVWTALYQAIRKANLFLENVEKVPIVNAEQRDGKPRMEGEARFLRAFFYAELHKRWGGVPILERALGINEDMNIARNSQEEVVAFIVSECNLAASLLPTEYTSNNLGRVTKGAALALKARTLLYAASLLHNPAQDQSKWKAAADAAKEVMELGKYSLHDNYKLLFHTRVSPEIIFQHTVNYTDFTLQTFVPSQGGQVGIAPLQNLVDAYEMKNGQLPVLSYTANGTPVPNPASGFDPNNPYQNRDPRFYQSIIYNGAQWRGATIYTYSGAPNDGINGGFNNTQTGYYLAKTVDENASRTPSVRNGNNFWIYMRYAEVLLNYAEAQNESLSAPDQSVYDAVNLVRARTNVQMPPLPAGLTKEQMREKIRHERRIELAFEGHRYWDMKRWRIAESIMKEAYGMMITRQTDGSFSYRRILVENRVYKSAFDLFPIMQTELNRNNKLIQNPGY